MHCHRFPTVSHRFRLFASRLAGPQGAVELVKSPRQLSHASPTGLLPGVPQMGIRGRHADPTLLRIGYCRHSGAQGADELNLGLGEGEELLEEFARDDGLLQWIVHQQQRSRLGTPLVEGARRRTETM
jgi:hypothetical protein